MKTPHDFMKEAGDTINQRGTDNGYDKGQERSAARTAAVFNALTGRDLTEHEIWLLQICLKLVRNESKRRNDNIVDLIGYVSLMGEAQQETPLASHQHADSAAVLDTTPQLVETLAAWACAAEEKDGLLSGTALEVAGGTELNRWAVILHTERLAGETDRSLRARLIEIRKMQKHSKPRTPGRFA